MESFFSSLFPPTDKSVWQAQVQKELKDADAYESLRWHTAEGFTLEPFYTADDLNQLSVNQIQEVQKQSPGWLNAFEYTISDEKTANPQLRDDLTLGAEALVLTLNATSDLTLLLNGIKLSDTPIFFHFKDEPGKQETVDFVQNLKTVAPYQLRGGLLNVSDDMLSEVTHLTANSPQFRTICASSHVFHNAGATATQELAFMLASLVDTYDKLTDLRVTINQLISKTLFSVSVGISYFLEVAKLRALRVLFNRLASAYSTASPTPETIFVHAQTSTFYDATATSYTNMLRATTEAMAAIIGGCDALTVHPYNAVTGQSDRFSERIGHNVSILLKEESYLGKVTDPSAGSYYVETVTSQLTEAAWTLFLAVEKQGGFAKALAEGFIQAEIEKAYQAKVEAVKQGKVLVGVTKFQYDEKPTQHPISEASEAQVGLLPDRRLAATFE